MTQKNDSQVSTLLDKATEFFFEGKFKEAINEAKKYLNSEDPKILRDAKRILGQAYFQLEEFLEAKKYLIDVVKNDSSYVDYFNLCTSATMSKDFSLAEKSFQSAVGLAEKEIPAVVINLTYYYIRALLDSDEYDNAFDKLKIVTDSYFKKNGITDLTQKTLYFGSIVPSFEDLISFIPQISKHIEKEELNKYLSDLYEKVDSDGKKLIDDMKNSIV